jgi:hypothetical protein
LTSWCDTRLQLNDCIQIHIMSMDGSGMGECCRGMSLDRTNKTKCMGETAMWSPSGATGALMANLACLLEVDETKVSWATLGVKVGQRAICGLRVVQMVNFLSSGQVPRWNCRQLGHEEHCCWLDGGAYGCNSGGSWGMAEYCNRSCICCWIV